MIIDVFEDIWIKICLIDIFIGVIYRHPKYKIRVFLEKVNKNLGQLDSTKLCLVGEMNVNISYTTKFSKYATVYVNMLATNVFFPLIILPTRITNMSPAVIAHGLSMIIKVKIILALLKQT